MNKTQNFTSQHSITCMRNQPKRCKLLPIQLGEGAVGQAAAMRAPVQIADALNDPEGRLFKRFRPIFARSGYRSILAVPMLREERQIIGGLVVLNKQ